MLELAGWCVLNRADTLYMHGFIRLVETGKVTDMYVYIYCMFYFSE